jgi:hypothetical protein
MKNRIFLAAQNWSKLRINDIYMYIKRFQKFGEEIPSQKKVIKVQSIDYCIFAGDFGTRPLWMH